MEKLVERLRDVLPAEIVTVGGDIPQRQWKDWSGLDAVQPAIAVRPRTVQQVAQTLRLCHEARYPVVPQGGLTGLAGGAHPQAHCLVLSLDLMSGIEEIDPVAATMTVWAGTPLAEIQEAAHRAGLQFPVDLGARGSCQIGGNVATNAGGIKVIRYGMMRDNILGLEYVLADGTVISSLNKMLKNNAGYDLKQLVIGSEGTLAVVTRVVLKLQPRPSQAITACCACKDYPALLDLLKASRAALGPALSAFEVMWPSYHDFMVGRIPTLRRPFAEDHGLYVLLEASAFANDDIGSRLNDCLGQLIDAGIVSDVVIAGSERDSRDLWLIRDSVSEYGRLLGKVIGFDIGIPITRMDQAVQSIDDAIKARWTDAVVLFYGHIGDSNLHVVIHVPSAGAAQPWHDADEIVYALVGELGGTISAEHGIGTLKRDYLSQSRSAEEIMLMRTIKQALDPHGILNPGKIFQSRNAPVS